MTDRVYHFVGVDLHKKTSYITVLDESGKEIFKDNLPNRKNVIQDALLKLNNPDNTRVAVEATFNSNWLVDILNEINIKTVVINPKKTKAISSGMIKTDKVDSWTIAELNRLNSLATTYVPTDYEREIRDLTRLRLDMVNTRTRSKLKIINFLHRNCIYKLPYRDMFCKSGIEWLTKKVQIPDYQKELIKHLLTNISDLDKQIDLLEKKIRKYTKESHSVKLLKTVPGISDILGLTLVAEIGNIQRFYSSKALSKFAGLIPRENSSGDIRRQGEITKEGSSYIRRALGFIVPHMVKKNPKLKEFYEKKVKHKPKKKVKVACMRKILSYIYFMLKEGKKYTELDVVRLAVPGNPRRQT